MSKKAPSPVEKDAIPSAREDLLRSRTLVAQVAEHLAVEIQFCRIEPGARLTEAELTRRFAVSRSVVREALQQLKMRGLVEDAPWKGARVVLFTREGLEDHFEFRAILFSYTVRMACRRAGPAELAALQEIVEKMERLVARGCEAEEYEELRMEAHARLLRAMGSTYQTTMRRRMLSAALVHQYTIEVVRTPEQRSASARHWRRLVDAIAARDEARAEAVAHELNRATGETILAAFDRIQARGGSNE
ncbi:MAG: GntR family transcriptional regulator [Alphaproteobacteria bacterium]|nr:GntR family transcriptional regulator [Alphaproteobacteria bacterium]